MRYLLSGYQLTVGNLCDFMMSDGIYIPTRDTTGQLGPVEWSSGSPFISHNQNKILGHSDTFGDRLTFSQAIVCQFNSATNKHK